MKTSYTGTWAIYKVLKLFIESCDYDRKYIHTEHIHTKTHTHKHTRWRNHVASVRTSNSNKSNDTALAAFVWENNLQETEGGPPPNITNEGASPQTVYAGFVYLKRRGLCTTMTLILWMYVLRYTIGAHIGTQSH